MPESFDLDTSDGRQLLASLLIDQLTATRKRLRDADGQLPASPPVRLLADCLSLDALEAQILDYVDQYAAAEAFRQLLPKLARSSAQINRDRLARLLDVLAEALATRLKPDAPLRVLGLAEYAAESDLEDFLRSSALSQQLLDVGPETVETLLDLLIESAPAANWTLDDFPHLGAQRRHLGETLGRAVSVGASGMNALLDGPPGTGNTELARALAVANGLHAHQVRSSGAAAVHC